MVALFIASIMNYQREKQHENDVKSAVRECKQSGWNFFTGDKTNTLGATCGKWEYHFTDSSFARHVCREAIAKVLQLRQKCLTQEKVCAAST